MLLALKVSHHGETPPRIQKSVLRRGRVRDCTKLKRQLQKSGLKEKLCLVSSEYSIDHLPFTVAVVFTSDS
jgi:hypothetical protein